MTAGPNPPERPAPDGSQAPAAGSRLVQGFARGLAWTWLAIAATGLSSLFTVAWAVRRLGTEDLGRYVLAVAVFELLTIVESSAGLSVIHATARAEESGSDQERLTERLTVAATHGAYSVVGLLAVILTGASLGLQASGLRDFGLPSAALLLLGLAASVGVATAALPAIATGCRRFSTVAISSLIGAGVKTAATVVLVGRLGITGLAIAYAGKVIGERAYLVVRMRAIAPWFGFRPVRVERAILRKVALFAAPLLVLGLSAQLFTLIDLLVVGTLTGASTVALYQVGSLIPLQLRSLLLRGYSVSFPAVAGARIHLEQETATIVLTRLFAYGGGALFALVAVCRSDVVHLVLGRRSPVTEAVILAFCVAGAVDVTVHGWVSILIARGLQKRMAWAVVIELPANLLLTIALVSAFGLRGAAVSFAVTVAFMDFVVFPLVSRRQFAHPVLGLLLRHGIVPAGLGALASGAAGGLVFQIGSGSVERIATTGVAGAAASIALGLALLGPSGRATLRAIFAPQLPVGGVPAPS